MSQVRHLVLDCDPGCDDALAMLLAFDSEVYQRIQITTVAGNVGVEQTTANAARICALAQEAKILRPEASKKQVGIWKGARFPLSGRRPSASSVHGRDGMGDVPLSVLSKGQNTRGFVDRAREFVRDESAIDLYRARGVAVKALEVDSDLVCTGPMTNLAQALATLSPSQEERFWNSWKRVVVMGGALRVPGNVSYAAEFNVAADPHAFDIVISSWNRWKPPELEGIEDRARRYPSLILVPLDVTEKVVLNPRAAWLDSGENAHWGDWSLWRAVYCILRKYFLFHATSYRPVRRPDGADVQDFDVLLDQPGRLEIDRSFHKAYEDSRFGGGSGMKKLPQWCFLHDPVAMWVAIDQWGEHEEPPARLRRTSIIVERATVDSNGAIYESSPREVFSFRHNPKSETLPLSPKELIALETVSAQAIASKHDGRRCDSEADFLTALTHAVGLKDSPEAD